MSGFKRKKLNMSVKNEFQRWLGFRILGVILLSSLVASLILYFYARNEIATSFFDAHVKIRRVSDLLLPVVIAGSMVSVISGIILSLFLPQKLAGPIYRIEQDIKPVQEGDLTSLISLRKEDILKDLAAEVNKVTTETRARVEKCKKGLTALVEELGETAEESEVQAKIQELQQVLAQFKTR